MGNDVTTIGPNPFESYGHAATSNRFPGIFMKFNKGDFLAGQDNTEIPIDTQLVAAMDTLQIGFVKWQDNKPVSHVMGRVIDGFVPPRRSELGDNDESEWEVDDSGSPRDPHQLTNYLVLVNPAALDEVYTFATSSKGGMGAIGELAKTYGKIMRQSPDEYPIIALRAASYQHKDRSIGRIKYPVFPVVGTIGKAEIDAAIEGSYADAREAEQETPAAKAPAAIAAAPAVKATPAKAAAPAKAAQPVKAPAKATPPAKAAQPAKARARF
jgi:hypothetical protein